MLAPEVSAEPDVAEPTARAKAALPSIAAAVRVPTPEPTIEYQQPEPLIEPPLAVPPSAVATPEPVLSFHSAATQIEPDLPPPPAPPLVVAYGPQPTASQRVTVWQLAAALLAAALLSIGPSLWELGDYLRSDGEQSVARWAFFLLVLGVVQVGTLIILVQVPDWSSVWIVTVQSLVLAAIYAAILGLTVITGGDSTLIGALSLDHQYNTGKAPMWCVCLAATYACLAFFAGRFSAKWRKILRQMQAADESAYAH